MIIFNKNILFIFQKQKYFLQYIFLQQMNRKISMPQIINNEINVRKSFKLSKVKKEEQITINIALNQNRNSIQIFVLKNSSIKHVKKIIYEHLKRILNNNEYKLIIGLETVDHNYEMDYRLQEEIGYIQDDLKLTYLMQTLSQNQKSILNYKICRLISVGGFSKVYLLRDLINGKFKIGKFIHKEGANKSLIKQQYMLSSELKHPFIIETYQFIQMPHFYVIILNYCPGGELFQLFKQNRFMAESHARFYITEVLLALKFLHSQSIIYRDIKPQNVILDKDGHIRLVDFGLAKKIKGRTYSFCGSLDYMAPEMISQQGHYFQADYYSIGNLLYEILIGAPPFYHPKYTQEQTKYHIKNTQIRIPQQLELSQEVKDLLKKLLHKKPQQRLGFNGISQILNHKWFECTSQEDYLDKLIQPPFIPPLTMNFDIEEEQQHLAEYKRLIDLDILKLTKRKTNFFNCNIASFRLQNTRNSLNVHKSCDQYNHQNSHIHKKTNSSIPKKISLVSLLTKRMQNLKIKSKSNEKNHKKVLDNTQSYSKLLKTKDFPFSKKLSLSKLKSIGPNLQNPIIIVKEAAINNFIAIHTSNGNKQNRLKKTSNNTKAYFKRKA